MISLTHFDVLNFSVLGATPQAVTGAIDDDSLGNLDMDTGACKPDMEAARQEAEGAVPGEFRKLEGGGVP